MKFWGQAENMQIENKTSDYSAGPVGRVWWRTDTSKFQFDDGTNIRAMLRNDQSCVFGNSGTANNNIRFQRGASGVLQFVQGGDSTAEGTLSTSLAQISGRLENYATVSLPAFGNAGRLAFDTSLLTVQIDTGSAWLSVASGAVTNRVAALYKVVIGSAAQVASGAATHSTWATGLAAASDGDNVLALVGAWTENVTISNKLNITGSGYGTVLTGTVTFASGSSDAVFQEIKFTGNLTINSGVNIAQILTFWLGNASTITDNGTGTFIQGVQE